MKNKQIINCERWLAKKLNVKHTKKNIKLDYLNKKLIDSLNFLNFIFSIQEKYKIKFNKNHFKKRNYRNIEEFAKIIIQTKYKK